MGEYKSFDQEIEYFKRRTLESCIYIACDPSTLDPLPGELKFIINEANEIADKWNEFILVYFDVEDGGLIINIDVMPKKLKP